MTATTPEEHYPCYVKVSDDEQSTDVIELPTEKDGTIILSTIQSQFPNAIGLKYKSSGGAWRGIRLSGSVLDPPFEGWCDIVYYITLPKTDSVKRKLDESPNREPEAKLVKTAAENEFLSDLIVLGLPYKATTQDVKDYFSKYGELAMHELCDDGSDVMLQDYLMVDANLPTSIRSIDIDLVGCFPIPKIGKTKLRVKVDPVTKESRGFAFVRFKNASVAQKVLKIDHNILGRRCEVKLPKKKESKPEKLFIGRLPVETTENDLRVYFRDYGELTDVYLPSPFRGFGFVTYATAEDAQNVMHQSHTLKGQRINVTIAEPKNESRREYVRRDGNSSSRQTFDFEDMRRIMYNNSSNSRPSTYLNAPGAFQRLPEPYTSFGPGKARPHDLSEGVVFLTDPSPQNHLQRFWIKNDNK